MSFLQVVVDLKDDSIPELEIVSNLADTTGPLEVTWDLQDDTPLELHVVTDLQDLTVTQDFWAHFLDVEI